MSVLLGGTDGHPTTAVDQRRRAADLLVYFAQRGDLAETAALLPYGMSAPEWAEATPSRQHVHCSHVLHPARHVCQEPHQVDSLLQRMGNDSGNDWNPRREDGEGTHAEQNVSAIFWMRSIEWKVMMMLPMTDHSDEGFQGAC
ncbi:hypothetical protein MN608_05121 [Microdochium nivale]|nr:hypothetical protein MN608_05121 [Microdochium nivale]